MTRSSAFLRDLSRVSDPVVDPEVLASYQHDQAAPGLLEPGEAAALVRPREAGEVAAAVECCARHRVPVVARGAGSGLSGGANAIDGCLVISTERMTRIEELDSASAVATVQAGVVNGDLRSAANAAGLHYAPDPASYEYSTIGGNVATNAGGMCCVKYGVTRESLLGVEAVLASGRVVRLGRRTRKGVAGYDLVSLLCGSEGTLGVITAATVRLRPPPLHVGTVVATFDELEHAAAAVRQMVASGDPAMLELMDRATLNAVEDFKPMDLDRSAAAMLLVGADGDPREPSRFERACTQAGASFVAVTDDAAEARMLTAARRLAYPALERLGTTLLDDVCVPVGRVVELIAGIEHIALTHAVPIATFGHAGDGNMHPTIVYDAGSADERRRGAAAFEAIIDLTLALGGTMTGEHGVGSLKHEMLVRELGDQLDLHQRVKDAFDPAGLLNPGRAGVGRTSSRRDSLGSTSCRLR